MGVDFASRRIEKDTWVISGAGCDSYLLCGDDEAIMIDSGMSAANIREFAETLTERPVRRVINTHSHFDHTAGNGHFEEILCTKAASKSAKNTMGGDPNLYPLDYEFTFVSDKQVVDIGKRPLEIIELNCHSPGDIVILDKSRGFLFCGDEIESRSSLLLPGYSEKPGQIHAAPAGAVETFLNAMKKVKGYESSFEQLCPAHNGSPMDRCYVDWYIELAQMIIEGFQGSDCCESLSYTRDMMHFPYPGAGYRRASHKGASLVYNENLILEGDRSRAESLPPATPLHIIASYYIR